MEAAFCVNQHFPEPRRASGSDPFPPFQKGGLPVSRETLESLYPGFVHDDAFYLAEFVAHELGPRWSLACLPNGSFAVSPTQRRFKAALLFTNIPD